MGKLENLARLVADGDTQALPELFRLSMRSGLLPTAGKAQVMIRNKTTGEFWTGGRSAEWHPVRAKGYNSVATAKRAAKHANFHRYLEIDSEKLSSYSGVVQQRPMHDGRVRIWIKDEIEIVEVLPLVISGETIETD